jgi:hypothetical protein
MGFLVCLALLTGCLLTRRIVQCHAGRAGDYLSSREERERCSLDWMHTYWKNCPVSWEGGVSFQGKEKEGESTDVLEAVVADHCLWFVLGMLPSVATWVHLMT